MTTSSTRTLGAYRLVAALGEGGMARVYLALSQKQGGFNKLLVLKVLRSDITADTELLPMFLAEANIAARLSHPNVVHTYEVGEDRGLHYIAMEYLEGQTLSRVLAKVTRKEAPLDLHVRVLCDVLEGLHYAHELTDFDGTPLGIVHRDVSPQNIFVAYTGQSKLLDFGIAKVSGTTRTQQGVIKGKAAYMAPEQARGGKVGRSADIFAMGVMLWEALAGRRLVQRGEEDLAVLARRIMGNDPPIREAAPDAPAELLEACEKAMALEPEKRFATAAEMRAVLESYLKTRPDADARALGAFVTSLFQEERSTIRKSIEAQVNNVDSSAPMINLVTQSTATPPSIDISIDTTLATSVAQPPSMRGSRTKTYLAVGAAAAALCIVVVGTLAMRKDDKPAPAASAVASVSATQSAPQAVSAPAPSASAPADMVLTVHPSPATATVVLDGRPLAPPFEVRAAKDGTTHRLEVRAPGFVTTQRDVVYSQDLSVDVTLSAAAAPPPTATAVPNVDLSTMRKTGNKRTVDDKDPYK